MCHERLKLLEIVLCHSTSRTFCRTFVKKSHLLGIYLHYRKIKHFLSNVFVEHCSKLQVIMSKENLGDRMSSVVNLSKYSVKSQKVIAEQDSQIARMRQMMIAAGLDPDAAQDPGLSSGHSSGGLMPVNTKKRMPSGSPEGKLGFSASIGTGTGTGSAGSVVQTQGKAQLQYVRYARYRLYVQSMKAKKAKKTKKDQDPNCQRVVTGQVAALVTSVAPVVRVSPFANVTLVTPVALKVPVAPVASEASAATAAPAAPAPATSAKASIQETSYSCLAAVPVVCAETVALVAKFKSKYKFKFKTKCK